MLDAVVGAARHGGRGEAACSAGAWWSTAAATPRSTSRAPPSGSARPTRSSSTAARARRCRRTTSRSRRRSQEGVLIKWLSTIKNMADEGTLTVEKMALDEKGFPQPTGEFETLEADSLVLALGQDVDLAAARRRRRASTIKDGAVQVGPQHDDRPSRASSPAATWCRRSAPVTVGDRPRQEGRAPHRRVAARQRVPAPRRSTSWRRSTS